MYDINWKDYKKKIVRNYNVCKIVEQFIALPGIKNMFLALKIYHNKQVQTSSRHWTCQPDVFKVSLSIAVLLSLI